MSMAKIKARHLERHAVIYVRQSSPKQVLGNRESTARQYALDERALELGWSEHRVIPFQIHNHPWSSFQAAAALTIAQSRLMMDVIRAGFSEKYVHACSTALRASSTVGNSLFARKFDFR